MMTSASGVAAFVDVLNASRRIGYPPGAVRGTISAAGAVEVFVNLSGDAFEAPATLEDYVEGVALAGTPGSLAAAIARAYSPETLLRALPKNVLLEALRLHPEVASPTSIVHLDPAARQVGRDRGHEDCAACQGAHRRHTCRPSSVTQPKPRLLPYAPASIVESSSDEEEEKNEEEDALEACMRLSASGAKSRK